MAPRQHIPQERFLVGVVVVERGLGQPTSSRQCVHGGAVVAEALEGIGAAQQQFIAGYFQWTHGANLLLIRLADSTS
ncbi:hypothetical protein FQZ97_1110610 [compost metagenome]